MPHYCQLNSLMLSFKAGLLGTEVPSLRRLELNQEGASLQSLAQEIGAQSSGPIKIILNKHGVPLRTEAQNTVLRQESQYYRMDENGRILEIYHSFGEIGRWLFDNGYTVQTNLPRAGMSVRRAILSGKPKYDFYWDSNRWTEEEKKELLAQNHTTPKRSYDKPEYIPSRSEFKDMLKEAASVKELLSHYKISKSVYYSWRKIYCLGFHGEDLEGWELAPQQYDGLQRADGSSKSCQKSRNKDIDEHSNSKEPSRCCKHCKSWDCSLSIKF